MERTQIYLERAQKKELEHLARREGGSISSVIRDAIEAYLVARQPEPLERIEDHPLWPLVGMIKDSDGPTDGADNHDKYIYGRDIRGVDD